jgi:hypothetical protein
VDFTFKAAAASAEPIDAAVLAKLGEPGAAQTAAKAAECCTTEVTVMPCCAAPSAAAALTAAAPKAP